METLINEKVILQLVNKKVSDIANETLKSKLDGITWNMNEFRKNCCGNKSPDWVATFIFVEFKNEINYRNGGWHIPAHGKGTANIIFAKKAMEWMEKNQQRIDWDARLERK